MKIRYSNSMTGVSILGCCALLFGMTYAQGIKDQPQEAMGLVDKDNISVAMDKAKPDTEESIYYVEQLAHAGAVQAVPMLEEKFSHTHA